MIRSAQKIVICGATGMVGSHLAQQLHGKGYRIALVGRDVAKIQASFPFEVEGLSWQDLARIDAAEVATIINLTGAGVSDYKWTESYKRLMRESRIQTTRQCVEFCRRNTGLRLMNASAVSAYGFYDVDHPAFTEEDRERRTGTNFLQELIDEWESTALKAGSAGNPVVLLRIGVVLDRSGGALPSMAAPFRFFFGGPVGTGSQVMSWIGVNDLVNGIEFLIEHREINGAVNLVSPGACRQREFAKALGQAMNRPSLLPTPAFAIRAFMGQLGQELVLTGQRVTPQRLLGAGFKFQDDDIGVLLRKLFERSSVKNKDLVKSTRPKALPLILILMLTTIPRCQVVLFFSELQMFGGESPDAWLGPWISDAMIGYLLPAMIFLLLKRKGAVVWASLILYNAIGAFDYFQALFIQYSHPLPSTLATPALVFGSLTATLLLQGHVVILLFTQNMRNHFLGSSR
jgi:uncharacterized protein